MALRAELEELRERGVQKRAYLVKKSMSLEGQLLGDRQEAEAFWAIKKEEFIKSQEFATLCSGKALKFFELRFQGCAAQLKVNGYSESHPFPSSEKGPGKDPKEEEMTDEDNEEGPNP